MSRAVPVEPDSPVEDTPVEDAPKRRRRRLRSARLAHITATTVVALLGAVVGVLLVPPTKVDVGPLIATVHLRPSLESDTVILLPPVGEVAFDTHTAPVRVEARVQGVDMEQAEQLLWSSEARTELTRTVPEDLTGAAARNAALNALFGAVGAGLAVGLTFRRLRRSVLAAGSAVAVVAASVGAVSLTFRPDSLYQPRFEGLLSQAAYVADVGQGALADYSGYRDTLAEFVGQVSALYIAADSLSPGIGSQDLITVLHVSDIHDNPQAFDVIEQLNGQFDIDAVIDTGDIVSWGTPFEHDLLSAIGDLDVPYVYIAGNHDSSVTAATVADQPNGIVLENEIVEVAGLRIAGVGDPRFAADDDSDAGGWREGDAAVQSSVFQLGETIVAHDEANPETTVDVALVHDPTQPEGLEGRVPLVLSGHMHTSSVELDRDGSGTDWMIVGSTGGALGSGGVRPVLDGGEPLDLTARLLYFDAETRRLVAYDDIVMGGLGLVSISVQRTQMPAEAPSLEVPEDAEAPPTPTPTDLDIEPGEGLPDEQRVTPTDPSVPMPEGSDGGEG